MQENTNKALFINSIYLYVKLIIITLTGLVTTRYALQALGVDDYGLFAVIGSVISFIGIFNTIMISASHRFISVAVGKNNTDEINQQFNVSWGIHIAIAIVTLILVIPLGDLYIYKYINYNGPIENAVSVFLYCVIGSVISFVGVPYNALLMAKERFAVFSITDIVTHLLKMGVAISLVYCFEHKLLIFAFSQAALTAITTIVYIVYCSVNFKDYVQIKRVHNKGLYKEVLTFSSWVAFGAFATVGKNQGAAVLINNFFSTIMNTALGLANTVSALLNSFSNSIASPMSPQITKSYAANNKDRCNELLIMSTKYTFIVTLLIGAPFLVNSSLLFRLWLGQVPDYVVLFTYFVILDVVINSMNSGISNLIFASGKITRYQVVINTLRILSIVFAFVVLKMGAPSFALLIVYNLFSVIIFFAGQWVLKVTLHYDNSILWRHSYIPSLVVVILFIPVALLCKRFPNYVDILIAEILLISLVFMFVLSKKERYALLNIINAKLLSRFK